MLRGLYTAANGMVAQSMAEAVLANNLANQETPGFKRAQPATGAFPWQIVVLGAGAAVPGSTLTATAMPGAGVAAAGGAFLAAAPKAALGTGALLDRTGIDWSEGEVAAGGPLDVAIEGEGFFRVDAGGMELYTRAGTFHVSPQGVLVDAAGRPVEGESGPIRLQGRGRAAILPDGTVMDGDRPAGRLAVFMPAPGATVTAVTEGAYAIQGGAQAAAGARLRPGAVETSNVDPVREMTELMSVARTYEASRQAFTAEDQAAQQAARDVGRY
ncbi:MAG: flagellar hook basal-body protein [Firmicutes bacterium]|nr:flagellar hook basal-body protein [Bacillota bacterium]